MWISYKFFVQESMLQQVADVLLQMYNTPPMYGILQESEPLHLATIKDIEQSIKKTPMPQGRMSCKQPKSKNHGISYL